MTLSPGTRLGPYEILALLGAGGMGEVYRARDTRLDRTVAVKVLPSHLSSSPEIRQRFEREAKTISQLTHPHICALYDVGREGETEFLVMEYLEGETLSERLAKGALPLEQTLRYGIEMADALDKAHRQAIVHRDLKPGNVMLTKSGVKLLDFGLAKLAAPTSGVMSGLSMMPTTPKGSNLTAEGTILGTLQYMAPEQLEGKEADGRTDIFAFGAVLYEMATGKKAFSGTSQASLIGAILKDEPTAISTVQPMSPPALDRVIRTCLAKDPEDRWQSAHDVAAELKWVASSSLQTGTGKPTTRQRIKRPTAWAIVAAIFLLGALVLLVGPLLHISTLQPVVRFEIASTNQSPYQEPSADTPFTPEISPDGRQVAFVGAAKDGKDRIWIRHLDSLSAQPIAGTDGAGFPFWSPDSSALAFFADGKLKRVLSSGGPIQTVCEAAAGRGGTWNDDGVILFAPTNFSPIHRVSASGGVSVPVTKLDASRRETSHRFPSFLPDGKHFLYTVVLSEATGNQNGGTFLASLASAGSHRLLSESTNARVAPSGHFLYYREGSLISQPLDLKQAHLAGEPQPIADKVLYQDSKKYASFSVSRNGVLAYTTRYASPSQLRWFDRTGKETGTIGQAGYYGDLRLAPNGSLIAFYIYDVQTDKSNIWVHDIVRNTLDRLTAEATIDSTPAWSPDGKSMLFSSARTGAGQLYQRGLRSTNKEEQVLPSNYLQYSGEWSPDGRIILYTTLNPKATTTASLWIMNSSEDRNPRPLVESKFDNYNGHFSPDGRWVAYVSDESGQSEVYLIPLESPAEKLKVSTGGGDQPRWRRDGGELYYLAPDGRLFSAEIKFAPILRAGVPRALFSIHPPGSSADYDVSADGQRFLVNALVGEKTQPSIAVVLNWSANLKK